ncbi:MAG TPA: hypothetical protein VJJ82_05950 [Candidatus Nanoarchaeia archaeon]|nr:hypothetical protein [Candidatus Nanoarchaeia archaeon]
MVNRLARYLDENINEFHFAAAFSAQACADDTFEIMGVLPHKRVCAALENCNIPPAKYAAAIASLKRSGILHQADSGCFPTHMSACYYLDEPVRMYDADNS